MRSLRRYTMLASAVAIVVIVGMPGVSFWTKADYCSGWAAHYDQRAAVLWTDHALAIAENRQDDANAIEGSAFAMAVIAKKYARVANCPLVAYPAEPLVTDTEIAAERDATRE